MSKNNEKEILLYILTAGSFLVPFMGASVIVAIPQIGSEFNMDAASLGMIAASFLLAAAAFLVPLGRISDIYGRKHMFVYGILIYSISSLITYFSNSSQMFFILRIIQGIAGAMVMATNVAMLVSTFEPARRGKAIGINVAAVYIGLSLGPVAGGIITQNFGWRAIFILQAVLGMAVFIPAQGKIQNDWSSKNENMDVYGSITYTVSIILFMWGLTSIRMQGQIALAIGIAGLVFFVLWERKQAHAVLNTALLLKNRVFAFSNLAALISYSATSGVGFVIALYLQIAKSLNPQEAGLILITQPAMQAMLSPFAGKLSDKIEPGIVASAGMIITSAGLLMLYFVRPETPLLYIVAALTVLGIGFAFFSSPNTNAVMSSVEKRQYGTASGVLSTMRLVGQLFSMVVITLVFGAVIGKMQINSINLINSSKVIMAVLFILCIAAVFFSLARGRVKHS